MATNDAVLNALATLTQTVQKLQTGQNKLVTRMGTLETRMNTIDDKIEKLTIQQKASEDRLSAKIDLAQEDTIDILTDIINHGYNMHEKRTTHLEKHAGIGSS